MQAARARGIGVARSRFGNDFCELSSRTRKVAVFATSLGSAARFRRIDSAFHRAARKGKAA